MNTELPDFVIERPTGTELLAWQLYADALDKQMKLQEQLRKACNAEKIKHEDQTQ